MTTVSQVDEVNALDIQINPTIFRAYDIRGVSDNDPLEADTSRALDLTPKQAWLIGKAFGTWLQRKHGNKVLLVRDNRGTSLELASAVIIGLLSTGCEVLDTGLGTTPMMYFGVGHLETAGGIMVTGSHNPMWSNGFKLCKENYQTLVEDEIQELYKLVQERDFQIGTGNYQVTSITSAYINAIYSRVDRATRPLTVVTDTGNAVGGLIVPELLESLGYNVVPINAELVYPFPNGAPDPEQPSKIQQLSKTVVDLGADIGLAFDGDVDRIGVVDEKGNKLESDLLLLLLARHVLAENPGAEIVFDVKCTDLLVEDIKAHGGEPVMWKTGHSNIKQYMKEAEEEGRYPLLGGELSGHMFFRDRYFGFDDAVYAACRLLEILSKSDLRMSQMVADLPELYSTRELALPCPDEAKFEIVDNLKESFIERGYSVIAIDGARVDFGKHKWALVRASNTQPKLTARLQAQTLDELKSIATLVTTELEKYPLVNSEDIIRGIEEVILEQVSG